jgi:hypothetical protein
MSKSGRSRSASSDGDIAVAEPTPSSSDASLAAAMNDPELDSKFGDVFGESATSDGQQPTRIDRQRESEELESLSSLDGADENDLADRFEKDGGDNGKAKADADEAVPKDAARDAQTSDPDGTKKDEPSDDGPTLSALLRHAAKRSGLDDVEIDEFYGQAPEIAEKAFTRLHKTYSDLSAKYAQLGQANTPSQDNYQQSSPSLSPPAMPTVSQQGNAMFSNERRKALQEEYGDTILDELKPEIDRLEEIQRNEQARASVDAGRQQEDVVKQINGFFTDLASELVDIYGKGTAEQSTPSQRFARNELGVLADQVRSGAASQGVAMSIKEALESASILHSYNHLEELSRKRLVSSVKQRSDRATIRPTHRGRTVSNKPKSLEAAEDALEKRAVELGVNFGHD